uniref:Uncharacterized protein n=1 Tax=Anopheles farauti TaxID=69004 RepID=A0A182QBY4_9DIPT
MCAAAAAATSWRGCSPLPQREHVRTEGGGSQQRGEDAVVTGRLATCCTSSSSTSSSASSTIAITTPCTATTTINHIGRNSDDILPDDRPSTTTSDQRLLLPPVLPPPAAEEENDFGRILTVAGKVLCLSFGSFAMPSPPPKSSFVSTDRISAIISSGSRGEVVFIDHVKRSTRGFTGSSVFVLLPQFGPITIPVRKQKEKGRKPER